MGGNRGGRKEERRGRVKRHWAKHARRGKKLASEAGRPGLLGFCGRAYFFRSFFRVLRLPMGGGLAVDVARRRVRPVRLRKWSGHKESGTGLFLQCWLCLAGGLGKTRLVEAGGSRQPIPAGCGQGQAGPGQAKQKPRCLSARVNAAHAQRAETRARAGGHVNWAVSVAASQ